MSALLVRFSKEEDEQLRHLIEDGATYSEAANALGRTRNAIAGRIKRLGLKSNLSARIKPIVEVCAEVPPAPPAIKPIGVDLLSLRATGCRFIISDAPTLYCGAQTISANHSWCAGHHALVFVPRQPRRV